MNDFAIGENYIVKDMNFDIVRTFRFKNNVKDFIVVNDDKKHYVEIIKISKIKRMPFPNTVEVE